MVSVEGSDSSLRQDALALEYLISPNTHINIKSTKKSMLQLHEEAAALVSRLKKDGIDAIVASDATISAHRIMTISPSNVIKMLVGDLIKLPIGTSIEYSGGVTLTANEVIGGTEVVNDDPWGPATSCTLGFNVGQIFGTLRGQSTAAHCANNARNSIQNKPLGFQQEWAGSGVDSQWHTFLGGAGYLIVGKIRPGSSTINVTGAQAVSPGSYICKYGITTLMTCGYVDTFTITDSYGTFPRLLTNSTYPIQALEGDSGGPVYTGSLAVGMTHARMTNPPFHNVFTPLTAWSASGLPIGVIACC